MSLTRKICSNRAICSNLLTESPPLLENFLSSFLGSGSKVLEWIPPKFWHLVEIFQIILLHVLSDDACKFAINLFPMRWGPFENVNLLYFLLKMQIWNGCNALNIAGNPIKDINVNLSFLSSGWKVVEWTPSDMWWKSCKFYFCMYCLMMHAHLPQTFYPSADSHFKVFIYYIFYWKCSFEMAAMCLILQKPHKRYQYKSFISEFRIKSCGMDPLRSDIWCKFFKFNFCMYCLMMHADLP